jgi:hypothetical protein
MAHFEVARIGGARHRVRLSQGRTAAQWCCGPPLDSRRSMMRVWLSGSMVWLVALGAAQAAEDRSRARVLVCEAPLAQSIDYPHLVATYGIQNVTSEQRPGADGLPISISVLFAKVPADRLEIIWKDDKTRNAIDTIRVSTGSRWALKDGSHAGSTLAYVELVNGRPFKLNGFGPETSGYVTDWGKGRLDSLAGGCLVGMRFAPAHDASAKARDKATTDKAVASTNPALRAVYPEIAEITLHYK